MAKIEFKGLETYIEHLHKLDNRTEEYIGKAIYKGADVVADAVKSAIDSIPVDNRAYVNENEMRTGLTTIQKIGLKKSFGIARMRKDGTMLNVKLGFDGYNQVVTRRWPKGQPNAMVARSIESGTSWLKKYRFMGKTVTNSKPLCELAMKDTLESEIKKIVKG